MYRIGREAYPVDSEGETVYIQLAEIPTIHVGLIEIGFLWYPLVV